MGTIRSINVARAVLMATLCGAASCSRVPNLTPHVAYVHIPDQITQATLIVVGTIESERVVRRVQSGLKEDPDLLELRAVRLRVRHFLFSKRRRRLARADRCLCIAYKSCNGQA